jgi:adiponectin receptor
MDATKQAASNAVDATKQAEKILEHKLTYLWHEIVTWQQDNHYIISGYRPQSNSYIKSYKSLGYLHNETVNIYTHLLGAISAFISSIILYRYSHERGCVGLQLFLSWGDCVSGNERYVPHDKQSLA